MSDTASTIAVSPTYGRSRSSSEIRRSPQMFQFLLQNVLEKLQHDPLTITTEDARRLHEHYDAVDERSARIITAVEALAAANVDVHEKTPSLGQEPHTSLFTLVKDLQVAVDTNPAEVTTEVLKTTQSVVSKMQKAKGQTNAPHPELEAELREEFAKIEPKVEQGTVTKAEADHLHSLEARAHGHTEKGGLTAIAQSVAAKRERAVSLSESINSKPNDTTNKATMHAASNGRDVSSKEQSRIAKENDLKMAELTIGPKNKNELEKVTNDAAYVQSGEGRAHNHIDKGSVASEALSLTNQNEDPFKDQNSFAPKDQSRVDKEHNRKAVEQTVGSKIAQEPEEVTKVPQAQPLEDKNEGRTAVEAK